MQYIQYKLLY